MNPGTGRARGPCVDHTGGSTCERRSWRSCWPSRRRSSAGTALAQERFGGLNGTVTDASGAVLPGATVTITSKTTGAMRTVTTASDGTFQVQDIEPGRYSITVELMGFSKVEHAEVNVLLGRSLKIDSALKVGDFSEVVNVTADDTPAIDTRSTLVAHNVTAEEIERMPKGRSFQSLALTAPSVNEGQIEGGIQVNGASGAENAYTVDGVVTNSLINGQSRQNTVFEYLQEVQVKTTGIGAEYGGALGGVISAVTKSGGNQLRGEVHYFYEGSALAAAPVKRLVLNPSDDLTVSYVDDAEQPDHRSELGGSIGGPIVRDRLFYFGSYSPRMVRATNEYLFNNGTEPGEIQRDILQTQAFGKLTYSGSRFTASGSVLYTPTKSEGTQPAYNGAAPNVLVSSFESNRINLERGFDQTQTNVTGNVDVTLSSASFMSVRGGYFYDNYRDTNIPDVTNYIYQTSSVGMPGVPASVQGPINTQNTPRALIVEKDATKRGFVNVDYNQNFRLGGNHSLKGGVGYQRTVNDADQALPGRLRRHLLGPQLLVRRAEPRARHLRLLRRQRPRRPRHGRREHHLAVRAGPVDHRQPAHAEPRRAHRERGDPVLQDRDPRERHRVRDGRQDRPAPRGELRRPRRRPVQGVRQLGAVLRLDEVRTGARLVRRRHLAGVLPRPQHAGRRATSTWATCPGPTCGSCRAARATAASRTSIRPTRTSSRCTRTAPASAPSTSSVARWCSAPTTSTTS